MSEALLDVKGLSKAFGGLRAVSDLSFSIRPREIVGLIGPNGAGKTTAFNLVTGYIQPDNGTVTFDGNDITNLPPHKICKIGICRTFQLTQPFPGLTVSEVVIAGALNRSASVKQARDKAERVLAYLGARERDVLFDDLTAERKKFLELATALSTEPRLLMLDEVAAGLTPSETENVMKLLSGIRNEMGIALCVIEHVMQVIMGICDRIIVLHNGEKICEGTPDQVSSDPNVVDIYVRPIEV